MATLEHVRRGYRIREFRDGKLVTVATSKTKDEGERMVARLNETRRARSRVVRGSMIPLPELIERWRIAKEVRGNDALSTSRAANRMRVVCLAQNWASTGAITAAAVGTYRQASGSTRTCAYLAGLLRWASDDLDQYVDPKGLRALRASRAARKPKAPLLDDDLVATVEARAAAISPSTGLLLHCLARYGWRPITAARMTVGDFDAVTGQVSLQVKGGDTVKHPLLSSTIALMRIVAGLRPATEPLFVHPRTGLAWELDGARGIPMWARQLGIRIYDIKRYAITSMLDRGIPAHEVALFTGHRVIGQVLTYARTNEKRARAALAKFSEAEPDRGKLVESEPEMARDRGERTLQFPGIKRTS